MRMTVKGILTLAFLATVSAYPSGVQESSTQVNKDAELVPPIKHNVYGDQPIVDTGVVSSGSGGFGSFDGLFDTFSNIMTRMREQMDRVFSKFPGESGFSFPALPDLDLSKGNTTSVTKVIDGHKVVINETDFKQEGENGGTFFKVRIVDVKPDAASTSSSINLKAAEFQESKKGLAASTTLPSLLGPQYKNVFKNYHHQFMDNSDGKKFLNHKNILINAATNENVPTAEKIINQLTANMFNPFGVQAPVRVSAVVNKKITFPIKKVCSETILKSNSGRLKLSALPQQTKTNITKTVEPVLTQQGTALITAVKIATNSSVAGITTTSVEEVTAGSQKSIIENSKIDQTKNLKEIIPPVKFSLNISLNNGHSMPIITNKSMVTPLPDEASNEISSTINSLEKEIASGLKKVIGKSESSTFSFEQSSHSVTGQALNVKNSVTSSMISEVSNANLTNLPAKDIKANNTAINDLKPNDHLIEKIDKLNASATAILLSEGEKLEKIADAPMKLAEIIQPNDRTGNNLPVLEESFEDNSLNNHYKYLGNDISVNKKVSQAGALINQVAEVVSSKPIQLSKVEEHSNSTK